MTAPLDTSPADGEALLLPDGAITPLVVNANEATRVGLAVLLQRQRWVSRCLMAEDVTQAVALVGRRRPEVALLDISDAGPFIPSMTRALHDAHPSLDVVLTSRCAGSPGAPLEKLGAVSFLPPTATIAETVAAVRAAVLSLDSPARSAAQPTPPPPPAAEPEPGLTDRELELLSLISTGATNREIAGHLHLGPDSIKKHAAALYRKLGVRNRTEAARRAAELAGVTP